MYTFRITNVEELKQTDGSDGRMGETGVESDVDAAVQQWCECLMACVKVCGGHFEHHWFENSA